MIYFLMYQRYSDWITNNLFPGMYAELLKRGDIPNAPYLTTVVSCDVKVAKPDPEFLNC